VSAADTSKAIHSFIKRLPKGDVEPPPEDREPIAELVYSFLLWESTTARADNAFKRVTSQFVDFNDLRVSRPIEVEFALGKTYPLLDERIMRLQASLQDIYVREYEVSLHLEKLSKRDARKYLESLEGMPPFVAARTTLFVLGAHAMPIEQRLLDYLIEAGVLDDGTDLEKAQGLFERHVKAEDCLAAYLKLQHFAERGPQKKRSTTQRKAASRKKTTTKKQQSTRKKAAGAKAGASGKRSTTGAKSSTGRAATSRKKPSSKASSRRASRS
jgi:hypothetical protein